MNLYLVTRTDFHADDYEEHDALVVCARDEEEARLVDPGFGWVEDPKTTEVRFIGVAAPSIEPGIVIGSFNAG